MAEKKRNMIQYQEKEMMKRKRKRRREKRKGKETKGRTNITNKGRKPCKPIWVGMYAALGICHDSL